MNIGANVSVRAGKTFSSLVEGFKSNRQLTKINSFFYEDKGSEEEWSFRYMLEKTWTSRIYKLKISLAFRVNLTDENIEWSQWKKQWQSKDKGTSVLCAALNEGKSLKSLIRAVDFEKIEIVIKDQKLKVDMIPVPGCFVWTLIPPMHYFVKLKWEEYAAIEKIASLIKVSCKAQRGPRLELVPVTQAT